MEVRQRDIKSIKPYGRNPRINDQAVEAVAASIREFGFRQPIVVDEDGVIIVGHVRWKAAKKLGLAKVPVHVARDLSVEKARAYRIADNQTAALAEWDYELLAAELQGLEADEFDLKALGFGAEQLAALLHGGLADGLTDPDAVPEPPDEATTQAGDIWILGNHRLLCGDATSSEEAQRLMSGATATMCFTDPPWNVAIGQDSNPRHRQRKGLANDDLDDESFAAFLSGFVSAMTPALRGDLYCVLGAAQWPALDQCLRSHGYHWSATVIWVKDVFVLGRSNYHRRYEPIWYGWRASGKSSFNDDRTQDDVWELPRPRRSEEHPTMKPVSLVVRAVANSSKTGDIVYDPFLGSGSTLIAGEQLGRKCYGIEIEPLYCDVIVRRWEEFTGQKAERQAGQVSKDPQADRGRPVKTPKASKLTKRTRKKKSGLSAARRRRSAI